MDVVGEDEAQALFRLVGFGLAINQELTIGSMHVALAKGEAAVRVRSGEGDVGLVGEVLAELLEIAAGVRGGHAHRAHRRGLGGAHSRSIRCAPCRGPPAASWT